MIVKLGTFPNFGGENKKCLSCHQLDNLWRILEKKTIPTNTLLLIERLETTTTQILIVTLKVLRSPQLLTHRPGFSPHPSCSRPPSPSAAERLSGCLSPFRCALPKARCYPWHNINWATNSWEISQISWLINSNHLWEIPLETQKKIQRLWILKFWSFVWRGEKKHPDAIRRNRYTFEEGDLFWGEANFKMVPPIYRIP